MKLWLKGLDGDATKLFTTNLKVIRPADDAVIPNQDGDTT